MKRGCFVTLEGSEGAGKTTQLAFIQAYLEAAGKSVVITREPGGTPLGEEIRALLLSQNHEGMSVDTELLLMFAARVEHVHRVIVPALRMGKWVVCDRFTDATYAYQGGGRGVPESRIAALESWALGTLRPDLTLLLDLPVEVGFSRNVGRGEADRFEREERVFFERVTEAYRALAEADTTRYRVIDASRDIAGVEADIAIVLAQLLENNP